MEAVAQKTGFNFKKILKIGLFIVGFIGIFRFLIFWYPYNFMPVFSPSEEAGVIRSLGQFSPPDNYVFRSVDKGKQGESVLIIYINQENGQKLFVTRLREHLSDNFDQIQVLNRTRVDRTFTMAGYGNRTVPNFEFVYLLPFFRKEDLSGMGDEAIIKGINMKSQERFETPAAEIFYVSGEFTKIGLYKEPKGRWHYPTPVFDFKTLHEGSLAFIKSKKSGRVVVAVSVNSLGQFQEKEFRDFVESFEPA